MLHELGDEDLDTETFFRREVERMSDEAVLAHLDSYLAAEFAASGFSSERYPETAAVLAAEVERRVRADRTDGENVRRARRGGHPLNGERAASIIEEGLPPTTNFAVAPLSRHRGTQVKTPSTASCEQSDESQDWDLDDDYQFEIFRRVTSQ
jgi:hypothetical protein